MAALISLMQRPPTAGSFAKGTSGNPTGKRKGTLNRSTVEAREAAASIVNSPTYRASLTARVIKGTAPHMEALLWAYAHGRPGDRVEQGGPGAFATMTDHELRARLTSALSKFK